MSAVTQAPRSVILLVSNSIAINPVCDIPPATVMSDSMLKPYIPANLSVPINPDVSLNTAGSVPMSIPSCMPTKTHDQPPAPKLLGTKEIEHEDPNEGDVGVGMARAIVDIPGSSSSVVRNSSLTLNNGFNVLKLEHTRSDTVDPSSTIALGADPIGGDD
ncbi:unnamed protein product [Amaranthus hypochondriacus]